MMELVLELRTITGKSSMDISESRSRIWWIPSWMNWKKCRRPIELPMGRHRHYALFGFHGKNNRFILNRGGLILKKINLTFVETRTVVELGQKSIFPLATSPKSINNTSRKRIPRKVEKREHGSLFPHTGDYRDIMNNFRLRPKEDIFIDAAGRNRIGIIRSLFTRINPIKKTRYGWENSNT